MRRRSLPCDAVIQRRYSLPFSLAAASALSSPSRFAGVLANFSFSRVTVVASRAAENGFIGDLHHRPGRLVLELMQFEARIVAVQDREPLANARDAIAAASAWHEARTAIRDADA